MLAKTVFEVRGKITQEIILIENTITGASKKKIALLCRGIITSFNSNFTPSAIG